MSDIPRKEVDRQRQIVDPVTGDAALVTPGGRFKVDSQELAEITEATATQDLSVAPLDFTTSFDKNLRVGYMSLKLTGTVSQTLTFSIDALAGPAFDTIVRTENLSADTDFFFKTDQPVFLKKGNEIRIQLTNNGTPSVTANIVMSVLTA